MHKFSSECLVSYLRNMLEDRGIADTCEEDILHKSAQRIEALQKELDELKASIPKIKSDVLTEFADEMLKCAHISNDDRYRFVAKRARGYAGQFKQGDTE